MFHSWEVKSMSNYEQTHAQEVAAIAGQAPARAVPAGPRAAPVVGWWAEVYKSSRDPLGYLMKLYREYGRLTAWGDRQPRRVFAFGPEYIQRMIGNPDVFPWAAGTNWVLPNTVMANLRSNIFATDGPQHKHRRKLLRPTFHNNYVESFRDSMVAITERMLDGWKVGEVHNVDREIRRLVHNIAVGAVISLEDPKALDRMNTLILRMYSLGLSLSTAFLPYDLPGLTYRRMLKTAEEIVEFLRGVVEQRRANPGQHHDMLAMLMASRDEDGVGLTDEQLISEAYNFMDHDTTASALIFTLFLLAEHPRAYAELLDELEGELRGDPPTVDQLARLPLLDRTVKEGMRLMPPVSVTRRFTAEPCTLGSYDLPKGATITFSQYITHRLEDVYPQPLRFRPSRWESIKPTPYEYFPFGAGLHYCLGSGFAIQNIKVVLATMLQRFKYRVVPGARIDRSIRLGLIMTRKGLPMMIAARGDEPVKSRVKGNINEMVDLS
jgi:cytochrome P450